MGSGWWIEVSTAGHDPIEGRPFRPLSASRYVLHWLTPTGSICFTRFHFYARRRRATSGLCARPKAHPCIARPHSPRPPTQWLSPARRQARSPNGSRPPASDRDTEPDPSSQIAQTCDITVFGHDPTDLWNPHLGSRKITAVRSHPNHRCVMQSVISQL